MYTAINIFDNQSYLIYFSTFDSDVTYQTIPTSCPLSPVKAVVSFLRHIYCVYECVCIKVTFIKKRETALNCTFPFVLRLRENIVHLITYPFKLVSLHGASFWVFFCSSLRRNIKGNRDFSAFKEENKLVKLLDIFFQPF